MVILFGRESIYVSADLGEGGVQIVTLDPAVRRGLGSTKPLIRVRGSIDPWKMDANSTSNQDHRSVRGDIDVFHSSVLFLLTANGNANDL